jgi:hypothetical protein
MGLLPRTLEVTGYGTICRIAQLLGKFVSRWLRGQDKQALKPATCTSSIGRRNATIDSVPIRSSYERGRARKQGGVKDTVVPRVQGPLLR